LPATVSTIKRHANDRGSAERAPSWLVRLATGFTITPAEAKKLEEDLAKLVAVGTPPPEPVIPPPRGGGSSEHGSGFPARGLGESEFRGETNCTGWKARATTETNPPHPCANGSAINFTTVSHLVEIENVPGQIEGVENPIIRDPNSTFAPPLEPVMRISFQLSA